MENQKETIVGTIGFASEHEMMRWLGRTTDLEAVTGFERTKALYPPPIYSATINLTERIVRIYRVDGQDEPTPLLDLS